MIKLDDNLLQEIGLGALSPDDKKKMLAHIYETLEMRVGMELAKQMSDAQLSEFEEFINRNDEAGALRWLEANFPNYNDVVAAEFEKLKGEIRQVAPQILASSSQQQVQGMPPQPMPQPGMPAPGQQPQQYVPYPPQQPGAMPQPQSGQYQPYPQQPMQPTYGPPQPMPQQPYPPQPYPQQQPQYPPQMPQQPQ